MIAFVRSVTAAATSAGSMFRSPSRTSTKTGVAPEWTITFAVAGQVIGVVITSSPARSERDQREVHRGRAGRDCEDVLRLQVLGHPLLEQRRTRPGRQPAGAERSATASISSSPIAGGWKPSGCSRVIRR